MSVIIRLQNLPWAANAGDIRAYFRGLSIPEGGVHIVGGEQGDAFIAFSTDEDARQAMQRDGGKLKEVMIKLLLSSRTEMMKVIEQARQQAMSLHQLINPPVQSISSTGPNLPSQQGDPSNLDKDKDDEDDKSSTSDVKRDRRRSRSRSRSRGRDRDRSRDRSRERDRSRDRRRDRRRRDRSRSRDRYRNRRDRSRDRRDRSRDREYFKSNRNRDARGSFEGKREQNETDSQKMQKTLLPDPPPPNKVLLPTPSSSPLTLNQQGKKESLNENFQMKKSFETSAAQTISSPNGTHVQAPVVLNNTVTPVDGSNPPEVIQATQNFIPPPEMQMQIPGFPAGMMFAGMQLRGPIPREGWFGPTGPQGPMSLAIPRLPMMTPEGMVIPNFTQAQSGMMQPFNPNQEASWNMPAVNKVEEADSNCCIEIHGIPLTCSYLDLLQFFEGFPVEQGGIKMINDTQGKRTGIAYVKFTQPQWKQTALNLNGKILNGNTVDIMHLKDSIFHSAIDNFQPATSKESQKQLTVTKENNWARHSDDERNSIMRTGSNDLKENEIKSDAVIIKGVPAKCSDRDIFDFFSELGIAPIHIHILQDNCGNPVGEVFCQFENPDQAMRASLKNNSNMGRSTVTVRVINKDEVGTASSSSKQAPQDNFNKNNDKIQEGSLEMLKRHPYSEVERTDVPRKRERVSRFDKPIDHSETPRMDEVFSARGNAGIHPDLQKSSGLQSERGRFVWNDRGLDRRSDRKNDGNAMDSGKDSNLQNMETDSSRSDADPRPLMEIEIPGIAQGIRSGIGDPNTLNPRNNIGGSPRLMESKNSRPLLMDPRPNRIMDPRGERNIDPRSDRSDSRADRSGDPRGMGPRGIGDLDPRSRNERSLDPRPMGRNMDPRPTGPMDPRSGFLDQRPRFLDPRSGHMGPRPDRPMDPRTARSMEQQDNMELRGDRDNNPRDRRMDVKNNRNMDPRQRNMNPRMEMNAENRQEMFPNDQFDNNMNPRDNRNMMPPRGENRDFPMEPWMERDGGFQRPFRGRPPLLGGGGEMRGDRNNRDDWGSEPFSKPNFGMDSGRGGMMRGRGRGRGDFNPRGRGGRGGGKPGQGPPGPSLLGPGRGPPLGDGPPFIEDDILHNFGGPGRVVAVENLHFKASVEEIIEFFGDFGIEYEDVIRRFDDLGRPTGDARIAFRSPDDARKAVDSLSSKMMMGRTIRLHLLS